MNSGQTGLGDGDNWKINVFWERTGYDVEKLQCTIRARIGLYYWTSEMGSRSGYITINEAYNNKQYVTTPRMNDYKNSNSYHCGVYSNWATFTVPMSDDGRCTITVSGYLDIKAKYLSNGVWQRYRTCGAKSFSLAQVETFSKIYGGRGNSFKKEKYVYKTTDYGRTWKKCNAYKTTNRGNGWSKIK